MLFLKLSGFYFFYFAAVGVYIIFLPKVLHDIGYSPTDIGIVLALQTKFNISAMQMEITLLLTTNIATTTTIDSIKSH